jgi:hypothetical protein
MTRALALIVSFSAARMTELAAITRSGIEINENEMIIKMTVKKKKKPITYDVLFKRRQGNVCPVNAVEEWMN